MPVIQVKNLTHVYEAKTPYEKKALEGVSLSIESGAFVLIIGANGSGKSTLIQHFNGLLKPTAGSVIVCGKDTAVKHHRQELWKEVGLVFQFPEQQLFAGSVFDEMAYGLRNLGLNTHEIANRIEETLAKMGLNPQEIMPLSPLQLSGGIRRQVALACVLAMRPAILVMDEPTAGLDPSGCHHIIKAVKEMQQEYHTTVVMVSHQVNELFHLADKLFFLEQGRLVASGSRQEVLNYLSDRNLDDRVLPDHWQLIQRLADYGYPVNTEIYTVEEVAIEIDKILKELS
ncbi:ATP-binding cassette domain-containing protein [Syntrophomonas erecta]